MCFFKSLATACLSVKTLLLGLQHTAFMENSVQKITLKFLNKFHITYMHVYMYMYPYICISV